MSAGNDIVVLDATDADRTCRYRFYSRIVSPGEIDGLFDFRLPFPSFVWILWSIKESVYKFCSRSSPSLVFAPLKIRVERLRWRDDYYEGAISFGGVLLYSRTYIRDGVIHSVVSEDENFTHTRWGMQLIDAADHGSQSARVRVFVLESLAAVFPGAALRIVKSPDGPPEVWDDQRNLGIPVSLSHHDRYVAWSFRLSANNSS